MAVLRDRPYGNARFAVDIGTGEPLSFLEVLVPELIIAYQEFREGADPGAPARKIPMHPRFTNLILRRGFQGSLELYQWWQAVAEAQPDMRRDVSVRLFSEDGSVVVATWRLGNAFPVRYAFSPMDGCDGSALIETLEITCESVEME